MNNQKFMEQSAGSMTVSELAEAIKLKQKEMSEIAGEPKLEVGDTIRIVQDWKDNRQSENTGKETILIKLRILDTKYPYRVRLKDGCEILVRKIEKVKPKEWTDITSDCEFRLVQDSVDSGSYNYFKVYHSGIQIAWMINDPIGEKGKDICIYAMARDDYEIEKSPHCNHFKILKKSGG